MISFANVKRVMCLGYKHLCEQCSVNTNTKSRCTKSVCLVDKDSIKTNTVSTVCSVFWSTDFG
jgi:hypothetical protein